MQTQLEVAKHRLFDKDALAAANIKLSPGSKRDVANEEVAEQINKALAQVESGDYEVVDEQSDD